MSEFTASYSDLSKVYFDPDLTLDTFIKDNRSDLDEINVKHISSQIQKCVYPKIREKWNRACRIKKRFEEKNKEWFKCCFSVNLIKTKKPSPAASSPSKVGGRPRKSFENCGARSKKEKINHIRNSYPQSLIDAASSKKLPDQPALDPNEALALMAQATLTTNQYETIRNAIKKLGYKIFPSYRKVLEAKKKCYPDEIMVSEKTVQVPLQNLLDHTVSRIFENNTAIQTKDTNLLMYSKWGCDGASGQNEFQQKVTAPEENFSDAHLFMTSFVPLKIVIEKMPQIEVWKNGRPSSTRLCRPIKLDLVKETPENVLIEKQRVDLEIQNLIASQITLSDGQKLSVQHKLIFTMIDGKTAQIVTNTTSASNCVICKATPSQMNDMSRIAQSDEEALQLGMSPLHARIKCMEYVVHLGYSKNIQKWRVSKDTKAEKDATKKKIQQEFESKLGLHIDKVRQGTGTSNSGNTSRRFFSDCSVTAEITGIDEELIRRLSVILEVITCNSQINSEKFGIYARETATLAIKLYPWYYLPATVHKILFHGKEIIENAVLPIGSLSEEAQECRNKDYRHYRIHNTRKFSRQATNEDVFHLMLITSDPCISSIRPEPKHKILPFSDDAKKLLSL